MCRRRAGDPLYEIALPLGGHRKEDRSGSARCDPSLPTSGQGRSGAHFRGCLDRRQWANAGNIWYNAVSPQVC
jgi:hypothetical protein